LGGLGGLTGLRFLRGRRELGRWRCDRRKMKSRSAAMGGIQFVVDEKGKKTAAVIDLKVHKALWEDIEDVLVSRSRSREKGVPLAKVKAGLVASGKLRG
jgi:hypothetical protein